MNVETHSLFSAFREEARRGLLDLVQYETHGDGVCLFREDDPSDAVYLVLSGEVELTKEAPPSRCVTIARVGADDYFGDMGPIDGCGRSTGAYTVGETKLAMIPAAPLLEILRAEPAEVSLQFFGRISERLRKANALFMAEVLRKERLHIVGEMASSIIHDIKNRTTGIQLGATLISKECQDEKIANCGQLIEQQANQMLAMAQELLDYSRGCFQLTMEEVGIGDLFKEIEAMSADYLRQENVEFSFRSIDAKIRVDKNRIVRVLQNLLVNAAEALRPDGGKVTMQAVLLGERTVEMSVVDNGPGIAEEIRGAIFEPFVTAGKKQGIGLGMAIAKTIVETHGGTISFLTETGKGTTFNIQLSTVDESAVAGNGSANPVKIS